MKKIILIMTVVLMLNLPVYLSAADEVCGCGCGSAVITGETHCGCGWSPGG